MKRKIITLAFALGVIFCLTGCKSKNITLTCTRKDSLNSENLICNYENGELKSAIGKFYYDESSTIPPEVWGDWKKYAEKDNHYCRLSIPSSAVFEANKQCKQSFNDKKETVFVVTKYDVKAILDSYAKDWVSTYDAAKDYFTENGYKCE